MTTPKDNIMSWMEKHFPDAKSYHIRLQPWQRRIIESKEEVNLYTPILRPLSPRFVLVDEVDKYIEGEKMSGEVERLMGFFRFAPVSLDTQKRIEAIRNEFIEFAVNMLDMAGNNDETIEGIRKILEAKDCMVRSVLDGSHYEKPVFHVIQFSSGVKSARDIDGGEHKVEGGTPMVKEPMTAGEAQALDVMGIKFREPIVHGQDGSVTHEYHVKCYNCNWDYASGEAWIEEGRIHCPSCRAQIPNDKLEEMFRKGVWMAYRHTTKTDMEPAPMVIADESDPTEPLHVNGWTHRLDPMRSSSWIYTKPGITCIHYVDTGRMEISYEYTHPDGRKERIKRTANQFQYQSMKERLGSGLTIPDFFDQFIAEDAEEEKKMWDFRSGAITP